MNLGKTKKKKKKKKKKKMENEGGETWRERGG